MSNIKIKFSKYKYTREEKSGKGLLLSRRDYDNKYLATVMQQLAQKVDPEHPDDFLDILRKSYKLFKPNSIEFVKNGDDEE